MSANVIGCGCSGGQSNTGIVGQLLFSTTVAKYIFADVADDGTRNFLDLSAADLDAELLGKINHPDPSKRFYPIYDLKNVAPEKSDATTWTADDGYEVKLLDGIKSQTQLLVGISPQYYAKIASMCGAMSEILVDSCGNLQGIKKSATATELYGRRINNLSYNNDFMNQTNADPSMATMTYQYKRIDRDSQLWLVPRSAFTIDTLDLKGMLDVLITATPLTNTTIQLDVSYKYGSALALEPWLGGVDTDISVDNLTSGTPPVVDSLVPDALVEGRYVLTISAPLPTTADELRVNVFRAATTDGVSGYEGSSGVIVSL